MEPCKNRELEVTNGYFKLKNIKIQTERATHALIFSSTRTRWFVSVI